MPSSDARTYVVLSLHGGSSIVLEIVTGAGDVVEIIVQGARDRRPVKVHSRSLAALASAVQSAIAV